MNIYKLLPGRENLCDKHIVWHKLVPDLLKLVIPEGMVGGGGKVPTAVLVVYDYCLSFELKETGRIYAVLVSADLVSETDRESWRTWSLVLFKLDIVHILKAESGKTKLSFVLLVEDQADVIKAIGYIMILVAKGDQVLPADHIVCKEDILCVFLGLCNARVSRAKDPLAVVVNVVKGDLKVGFCFNKFCHCCCGIMEDPKILRVIALFL